MDYAGIPAEFADGLNDAPGEENGAFVVFGGVVFYFELGIYGCGRVVEVVVVVNKVDLHSRRLQSGYLDDKRMVGVVDDYVHAGETDYFVELVSALVDTAVFRHESTHLDTSFLHTLGDCAAKS